MLTAGKGKKAGLVMKVAQSRLQGVGKSTVPTQSVQQQNEVVVDVVCFRPTSCDSHLILSPRFVDCQFVCTE